MFIDKLIFHPPRATYRDTCHILKLKTVDRRQVSAMYLPNQCATYLILYSHGNAEDLGMVRDMLEAWKEMGYSVFGYDYAGYGTSEGKPSEYTVYRDIDAAYAHITGVMGIPAKHIIVYGSSLGGAIAADLASRKPVGGLILESTFVSAFRVLTRIPLFPFDMFCTLSKLKQVQCPAFVIHGTADKMIDLWHGKKLYEEAREPKQYLWVAGAGHRVPADEQYWKALQEFTVLIKRA